MQIVPITFAIFGYRPSLLLATNKMIACPDGGNLIAPTSGVPSLTMPGFA